MSALSQHFFAFSTCIYSVAVQFKPCSFCISQVENRECMYACIMLAVGPKVLHKVFVDAHLMLLMLRWLCKSLGNSSLSLDSPLALSLTINTTGQPPICVYFLWKSEIAWLILPVHMINLRCTQSLLIIIIFVNKATQDMNSAYELIFLSKYEC